MAEQEGGWIKLHRKIIKNWVWEDPEKLRAWLDILLMVNHEDRQIPIDGHMVTIKAGQRHTSIHKLAKRWRWSKNRVLLFFRLLEESEMVTTNRTTNGTTITVTNWAFYQDGGYTNGTTNDTTNGYTNGYTNGTQTRMNKNIKNDKEIRAGARAKAETKKGVQRKTDLDAWLKNQTVKRLNDGG